MTVLGEQIPYLTYLPLAGKKKEMTYRGLFIFPTSHRIPETQHPIQTPSFEVPNFDFI